MFSVGDAKDVFKFFPPQNTSDFLPSLILSSGGHGFVTLEFVKAQFRSRDPREYLYAAWPMTLTWIQISFSNLFGPIQLSLYLAPTKVASGVIKRSKFAAEIDLDDNSIDALLKDVEREVVDNDGYMFSKLYEQKVSDIIGDSLQSSLSDSSTIDIIPEKLPGAPPLWFALRVLRDVLASNNLTDAYFFKEDLDGAQCYPKKLIEQNRDAVVADLRSGKLAYVDLQAFQTDFAELHSNIRDAAEYVRTAAEVDIVETFAISKANRSSVIKDCTKSLAEEGHIDLAQVLVKFPGTAQNSTSQDLIRDIMASYQDESGAQAHRVGDFLLKPESYDSERRVLLDYADVDAGLQWKQMQENQEKEVGYSLANVTGLITKEQRILGSLIKEKAVEKAVEERFWMIISQQESQNEVQFSEFWNERVHSRLQIYQDGLDKVSDEKLRDQLSEILSVYAKELILESVTKARSQGLVLSRKTRKNAVTVEDLLKQEDSSIASVLSALKKFNKKQGIEPLNAAKAVETKQNIVNDLVRRMQKQKKSDGPVLFLTLVLILFAKHNDGVVYATGKFAPKLLKQLKAVLPAEQYEQIEKWKEAAKTSSLTVEDRAAMKGMAEV
ncbi:hypothetical protein T440DRAFT_382628 [Plenodomus tracheiphilus IPT5]|uniref:Uncharacterized protein n=1 Tax=Plenodomus tracheiphilus IPT5 TaxID=1408161 RepID=A0A6A7BPD8_9PLEO|nr:hypothetical protein T440DRAFT_382628 [Plenodomus tracheiphilus IPT5]